MELMKPQLGKQLRNGHNMARGLVGAWLSNENPGPLGFVNDLSGNGNHVTLVGSATSTAGRFGNAILLTSGHALGDSIVQLRGTAEMSVVAWINLASATPSNEFIASMFGAGGDVFRLVVGGSGELFASVYATGGTSNPSTANGVLDGQAGIWHQVVLTYGVSSGAKVHLDGVVGSNADTYLGVTNSDTRDFVIGGYEEVFSFAGQIDHVLIYNRALSASEIESLYLDPFQMFEGSL